MINSATNPTELEQANTPVLLKTLSAFLFGFGLLAFFGSIFLWGEGFILRPPEDVNVVLPIADILVNAPASMVAAIGLWRLRRYGYLAGYFVAGLYLYASMFILVEAFTERPPDFWAIVIPQILAVAVALTLLFYLPRIRLLFR